MVRMQMRMIIGSIIASVCLQAGAGAWADDQEQTFQSPDAFLTRAFDDQVPAVQTLWPEPELRAALRDVLGRKPALRFKYWGSGDRTVWILDEVGKDRPITAGVVIQGGQIQAIEVLVFRESRGWEVKYEFFTQQFANLWLREDHRLSGQIDNITGATLSVKAMRRMAQAALLLHRHTPQATHTLVHAR